MSALQVVGLVGGILLLVGLILTITMRLVTASLAKRLKERWPNGGLLHSSGANFFGQRSQGVGQIRGNGALVLTKDELTFLLAVPKRELVIPLESLREARTGKSFLSKGSIKPLLIVSFETSSGLDEAAWLLKDTQKWQKILKTAIRA